MPINPQAPADGQKDHVLMMDLGPAKRVKPKVTSLGKRNFEPIEREAVVIRPAIGLASAAVPPLSPEAARKPECSLTTWC